VPVPQRRLPGADLHFVEKGARNGHLRKNRRPFRVIEQFRHFWGDYVAPLYKRPERLQFAALCYRGHGDRTQILLITSRDTGRWVLPKGWQIKGLDSAGSAMREAWEEAGVRAGRASKSPLGEFVYGKTLPGDWSIPVRTLVYAVEVAELLDDYPEVTQRRRVWVNPEEAADMVNEPGLKDLLRDFRAEAPVLR
jgi:8-oxo-dGTP pyrophosphatase MutT (NUDIX family)